MLTIKKYEPFLEKELETYVLYNQDESLCIITFTYYNDSVIFFDLNRCTRLGWHFLNKKCILYIMQWLKDHKKTFFTWSCDKRIQSILKRIKIITLCSEAETPYREKSFPEGTQFFRLGKCDVR